LLEKIIHLEIFLVNYEQTPMNWVFVFFLRLPVPDYVELIALYLAKRGFSFLLG